MEGRDDRALLMRIVAVLTVCIAFGLVRRAWKRHAVDGFEGAPGDTLPADPVRLDELVDTASLDPFPASDPPSYWARDRDRWIRPTGKECPPCHHGEPT